ncbi:MAG: DUF3850 domain-containing protein [Bacillota bacterium]
MAVIVKKVVPGFLDDILSGQKNFDLRLNDFEIEPGDTLILEEYTSADPATRQPTGRRVERKVNYVRRFQPQDLWWNEGEIREKGIQVICFDKQ